MSAAVFWAPDADLGTDTVTLTGPEARHAVVVRRLRPGERVDLTDGRGSVAHCVVQTADKEALVCVVQQHRTVPAPSPTLAVVQALPKGDRGEVAVETLTEVGVDTVVPWAAARCITQWKGERGTKAHRRWQTTAQAAAKQSRRAWWPEIAPLVRTTQLIDRLGDTGRTIVLHEDATAGLADLDLPDTGSITLVVGPEGGIGDEELARLSDAGAVSARLGPTVLRTSTAGTVAAGIVLSRVGRWRLTAR